jgi:hypothetical protein
MKALRKFPGEMCLPYTLRAQLTNIIDYRPKRSTELDTHIFPMRFIFDERNVVIYTGCRIFTSIKAAKNNWKPYRKSMWTETESGWGKKRLLELKHGLALVKEARAAMKVVK